MRMAAPGRLYAVASAQSSSAPAAPLEMFKTVELSLAYATCFVTDDCRQKHCNSAQVHRHLHTEFWRQMHAATTPLPNAFARIGPLIGCGSATNGTYCLYFLYLVAYPHFPNFFLGRPEGHLPHFEYLAGVATLSGEDDRQFQHH